ncbi:hypothetical protein [Geosporobacter ferrireducens]|uniref:Uncharacterized protein n=1 Tax=Geosporobacter ferrireducens TaxID=1424294 RepID=A0A1D8GJ43_9FIRM|nr:hypothetical protein [Geosporobacter ferrireducens]AOT70916.1 hypothetical protein Gferi_15920 [Geosporobacter ferrireducens]MTI53622.1 hypothetical protein [Geosporobacter ferrireducens]
MGKKLITLKEIAKMHSEGICELYVNDKVIITPGARDFAHDKGFRVIYGEQEENAETIENKIDILLQQQYQMVDREQRKQVLEKILEKIKE